MRVQRVGRHHAPVEDEGVEQQLQVAEFVALRRHAELGDDHAEPVRERAQEVTLGRALPGAAAQRLAVDGQSFERGGGRGAGGEDALGPVGHTLL